MALSEDGIRGTSIVVVLAGAVLAYSAVKGKMISSTTRSLIAGQSPSGPADPNLALTSGAAPTATLAPVGGTASSNVVVQAAVSQLGKPYAWAKPMSWSDPNPASFDCSGLTGWSYAKAGITLTHFTGTQYLQLKHRPLAQAQPGDLVFYQSPIGAIYHVAMVTGPGQLIEAPDFNVPVRLRNYSPSDGDIMPNVGVFPGSQ